ncbi:hypothetical protein BC831DRAFT_484448 [Entophlyctis helioformis]|nr:hypothetical protein BC831DRAFT_484448 [Entophlyctis helioformis]
MKVDGKVAIITGASSGFGKALAERLVGLGAKVVLGDVTVAAGNALANDLNRTRAGSAVFVKCDVTKKADLQALFDAAKSKFGQINIMVNNAGIAERAAYEKDLTDAWTLVLDIDLTAVILGTRLAMTEMVKQGKGGVIINTASLAGLYPQPLQPVYAAAKGGVVMFTRSMGYAADKHKIHVNAICPSFSKTGILDTGKDMASSNDLVSSIDMSQLVPVPTVIDAFVMAIEDESLKGDLLRVTPQYGIDIVGRGRGKGKKPAAKL